MTNSKLTKRALLSSVMALILCFTMLLGTTFAWFTDTASTSVNKIEAGTLDIQLLDASENSLEGKTLSWQKAAGHEDEDVLWEPGCTYSLQPITIKNNGSLALKYKIAITGILGSAKLNEVIEWTIKVGEKDYAADTEFKLNATESCTLTISGHMKDSAGNEYQGLKIEGIAITVYATQDTVEYDSKDNKYDANATYDIPWDGVTKTAPTKDDNDVYHITNAAELVYAMEHSTPTMIGYNGNEYAFGNYVLGSNIDLGGATIPGFADNGSNNFQGSFDGQGYTISNFVIDNSSQTYYAGVFGYLYGATVKNLNVSNATVIGRKQVGVLVGAASDNSTVTNCNVYNSRVIATKKVGAVVGYTLSSTVTNCSAENCVVYCKGETEDGVTTYDCNKIIGYENTGTTATNNTEKNVTVKTGTTVSVVSTAADLNRAIVEGGNILLTADIDGANWTSASVKGGHTGAALVIDGNGHTITGLTKPLLKTNSTSNLTVKNLTIKNSVIAYDGGSNSQGGNGAILPSLNGYPVTLENCHLENVTVEDGEGNYCGVGGFIGQHDAANLSITNCSVANCVISSTSNHAGAIIGHYTSNAAKTATIEKCTVSGGSVSGSKAGQIVGCVNGNGTLNIVGCTFTGDACPYVVNATVNVQ